MIRGNVFGYGGFDRLPVSRLEDHVAAQTPLEDSSLRGSAVSLDDLAQLNLRIVIFDEQVIVDFPLLDHPPVARQHDPFFLLGLPQQLAVRYPVVVIDVPAEYPHPFRQFPQHHVRDESLSFHSG